MFIDASAMTAMLIEEHDAAELLVRVQRARIRATSPLALWETVLAVARNLDLDVRQAHLAVQDFVRLAEIDVLAVPPEAHHQAIEAHYRFGKSRHPAALNFGDCFAYACARIAGLPLLYKGDDFALTDIETA